MPLKDLQARREYRKRYYAGKGKEKIAAGNKRWAEKNKPRMRQLQKEWKAKQKNYYRDKMRPTIYKPTRPEPLNCEGCGVPFTSMRKGSQCDHDHATGLFRGWLCVNCNVALGYAKDSRVILQKLIDYLDRVELLS